MAKKKSPLSIIADEVRACSRCGLCKERTQAVPGEGHEQAQVLFIGEGPGKDEDLQGRPFVGRSGKFLREMIRLVGLSEAEVFIANVVKCRPPDNRDPLPEEILACKPYLERQIAAIAPRVIVPLGRYSMARYLADVRISEAHGRIYKRGDGVCVMPMFHPAVALYSSSQKETLIRDMRRLPILLDYLREQDRLRT